MMIKKRALAGVAVLGLLAVAWAMAGRQAPGKALEQEPAPTLAAVPTSTPAPAPTPAPIPQKETAAPTNTVSPSSDIWDISMAEWGMRGGPTPDPTSPTPAPTPTPQPLFEDVDERKYTNTQANVRDTYSTAGNKLTTLSVNTEVQITGIGLEEGAASGWAKIAYEGAEAYIAQFLLSDSKTEIQQPVQSQKSQPAQQAQQPEQRETIITDDGSVFLKVTTEEGIAYIDLNSTATAAPYVHEVDTSKEQVTIESQGYIK